MKLLFTSERLSVQVHPDDGEDGPRGKTEMWHILRAEPGATIALGFREPITRERLRGIRRSGEIEQLVHWIPVQAGETYFTPAHTVHAIGGGIVLCEIQQISDVTYRLYDYGRPRELHLDKAAPISDLGAHPGAVPDGDRPLEALRDGACRDGSGRGAPPGIAGLPSVDLCRRARLDRRRAVPSRGGVAAGDGSRLRAETAARFLRTYVP